MLFPKVIKSLVDKWEKIINVGEIYNDFSKYDFGEKSGKEWINDRISELFEGGYSRKLQKSNQLGRIKDRLSEGKHGGATNALVAQIFQYSSEEGKSDLDRACSGAVRCKATCLTQIQFKPKRDRLHLFSVFRSQFLDAKAYGNLISLAILLARICKETNYKPGILVETTNNITFKYGKSIAKDLYTNL